MSSKGGEEGRSWKSARDMEGLEGFPCRFSGQLKADFKLPASPSVIELQV